METKWYCFLFWFSYRLTLACLAHFNWGLSIYTNCAYFTLWKSYDLLWFWMHFILCSCFSHLRRENYLIVWANLIIKKCTKYPDYSFKQLYYALYTTSRSEHFTKRLMSIKSKRGVIELNESSDEDDEIPVAANGNSNQTNNEAPIPLKISNNVVPSIPEPVPEMPETENEAEEHEEDIADATENTPLRPPRPSRPRLVIEDENEDEVLEVTTSGDATEREGDEGENLVASPTAEELPKWKKYVPTAVMKYLPRQTSSTPSLQSKVSNENGNSTSAFTRLYDRFRPNRQNSSSSDNPNEIDVLRPDYSNRYDCHDKAKRAAREKRDRSALRTRIRHELREQMKIDAAKERDRKKITDAIELLLQLLRMMSSFAMLIGNIRKTFIPAQFKYLRPGQNAYDNYELILLFRCTAFLDIAMFWMNVSYVYCLQWQLCCRLGCKKFFFWAAILGVLSVGVMFIPMTYVMNDLDLSWCRFMPNTTLAKYQPSW